MRPDLPLSELEFRLLRDLIHDRFGILLPDHKERFLRMKLTPRVLGLGLRTFLEYFNLVEDEPVDGPEGRHLITAISNNETYLMRELAQLHALRDQILPELGTAKREQGQRELRIVSAGCSTGEEVYSLAILMFETGRFFWDWDVRILGLDIDAAAIATARKGVYKERSFRMAEESLRDQFFVKNGCGYRAKPSISRFVEFHQGNITQEETWRRTPRADVLLCRNVLIYFSDDKMRLALDFFYECLRPGGYLLLGHSESLMGIPSRFEPVRVPGSIAYRRAS